METISARVEKYDHRKRAVIRARKKSKKSTLRGWKKFLKTFFENTTISGCKYLVKAHCHWLERLYWIIIHALTLSILIYTVSNFVLDYIETPVVTVVDSTNYPSQDFDFPAVSICNVNRISRKSAEKLATEILEANVTDQTFDEVMKMIKTLGRLYSSVYEYKIDEKYYAKVDKLLQKFYHGPYDISETMRRLTPDCESQLIYCGFRVIQLNCSEVFEFQKTENGYCCIFNYLDQNNPKSKKRRYKIQTVGRRAGLSVILEPNRDDYFFPTMPIVGWKVSVYSADDYLDYGSGGVSEALASARTKTYLQLGITSSYSTEAIRNIAIHKRKCVFSDEQTALTANYSMSDCLVACRAKEIQNICKCRPFILPSANASQRICNIKDIKCLEENKEKWASLFPNEDSKENSEVTWEDDGDFEPLRCNQCYPTCSDVSYSLVSSSTTLVPEPHYKSLMKGAELKDQSFVHVYFGSYVGIRMRKDLGYYWYQLLSEIGGLCGSFLGFSIISVIELIYFLLKFMVESFCKNKKNRRTKIRKMVNQREAYPELYWNELFPQPRVKPSKRTIIIHSRRKS